MNDGRTTPPGSSAQTALGDRGVLDGILERMLAGEAADVAGLARQHPELADEIAQVARVVEFVQGAAAETEAAHATGGSGPGLGPRAVLGDFEIIREVARGGMGVVYEATQRSLGRRVALKVMLPGVRLSHDALERFSREARTAGGMQHRHIVPVFAIGEEDGLPFYAMQFIDGRSLSEYLGEARGGGARPDTEHFRRVAEWGRQAAEALAYAHDGGVVHRDVKPSNMLLDDHDLVWLTDFGLARQDANLTITLSGDVLGTVRYMSPEQARGGSGLIDERTDVYSLGVSLFELLTLRPPFDGPDRESTLKQVLLDEPPALRRINRSIPAPLERIVLKAIEKDPERRYPSAALLGEDLRRFLHGEPLLTRAPGPLRQLARLAARHRGLFAAIAVVFALVLGFGVWMSVLYTRADTLRRTAERETVRAQQVQTFLRDALASVNPEVARGRDTTLLREILDRAAARIESELADQPEVAARLHETLGNTYLSIAEFESAEQHLQAAFTLRQKVLSPNDPEMADAHAALGRMAFARGEYAAAVSRFHEALAVMQALSAPPAERIVRILNDIGAARYELAEFADAERNFSDALELGRRLHTGPDRDVAKSLTGLALVHQARNELDESEPLTREALEMRRQLFGDDHPDVATAKTNLAVQLYKRQEYEQAAVLLREVLETRRKLLAADHPDVAKAVSDLAMALYANGDLEGATEMTRESLELKRRRLGDDHPAIVVGLINLAGMLSVAGDHAAAEGHLREALDTARTALGERHTLVAKVELNLASSLSKRGELDEAERFCRQSLETRRALLGPAHADVASSLTFLTKLLNDAGRFEAAEQAARELVETRRTLHGDDHPQVAAAMVDLADALCGQREFEAAEPVFQEALVMQRRALAPDDLAIADTLVVLGALRIDSDAEEAETLLRECYDIRGAKVPADDWRIAEVRSVLGKCLTALGRFEEAEPHALAAYELSRATRGDDDPLTRKSRERVAEMYEAWGRPDRAAEYAAP